MEEIDSYIVTRVYDERNKRNFKEAVSAMDWNEMYNTSDTQKSFDLFYSKPMKSMTYVFLKSESDIK